MTHDPPPPPRRRSLRVLLALLLLLLLAVASTPWSVPALLRAQGPGWIEQALGRKAALGEVSFDPLRLRLAAADLRIRDAADRADALRLRHLEIRLDAATLWSGKPQIASLQLQGLQLRLQRRADGSLDIDDIQRRLAQRPVQPASSGTPAFALRDLRIDDAALTFDDRAAGVVTRIDALKLRLPELSTLKGSSGAMQAQADARLNGAPLQLRASGAPFVANRPLRIDATLQGLDLGAFAGYQPAAQTVRLRGGRLAAQLHLDLLPARPRAMNLSGKLQLQGLKLDAGAAPLGGCDSVELDIAQLQPLAGRASIARLRLDGVAADLRGLLRQHAAAPAWSLRGKSVELDTAALQWSASKAELTLKQAQWQGLAFGAALQTDGVALHDAALHWAAQPAALQLDLGAADLDAFTVGAARQFHASGFSADQLHLDLQEHTVSLGKVELRQPRAPLARDAAGTLSVMDWLPPEFAAPAAPAGERAAVSQQPANHAPGTAAAAPSAPWKVEVAQAALHGGAFQLSDQLPAHPLALNVSELDLDLQHVTWPALQPVAFTLSARLADPLAAGVDAAPPPVSAPAPAASGAAARPPLPLGVTSSEPGTGLPAAPAPTSGTLRLRGTLGLAPLQLQARLDAQDLPAQVGAAYLPPQVNLQLLRALASAHGRVALRMRKAGPAVDFDGAAALDHLVANTSNPQARLLSWRSLQLDKVQLRQRPARLPATDISVGQVALDGFYARVVLGADAKLNLSQIWQPAPAASAPAASASAPARAATAPTAPTAPSAAPARATPTASPAPAASTPLRLRIGGIVLSNGRVDYTDFFVRPNYATSLADVHGSIGAFASDNPQPAAVDLHGTAQGDAPVLLQGSANPLLSVPVLDLHGQMTQLQLAPLSPYSGRYAGYAIQRGQLAMDVHYTVNPAGKLNADNKLTLTQLTFGDHVNSPDATKLPVLLAVDLLKDRDGNINLDIPISGSLNDPQFRLGPVIVKVIVNLLVRAVTAPFSLLADLFDGFSGEQLSHVAFVPGTAVVQPGEAAKLPAVAKAMQAKSALVLTVTGEVAPALEREPYREAQLEQQLLKLWKRNLNRADAYAAATLSAVPAAQRPAVLAALYRQTALPGKPRNPLGLPKEVGAAEMQARLEANIAAGDDRMQALAMQRAQVLRDALGKLGVAPTRDFVGAPALLSQPGADWKPEAGLALTKP